MRKTLITTMCSLALCMCIPGNVSAATEDVKIDSTTFPDEVFRNYVSSFDVDKNGSLSDGELGKITTIYFDGGDNKSDGKVASVKGIEFLSSVNNVYLHETKVTSLDLTQNSQLKILEIKNKSTENLLFPAENHIKDMVLYNAKIDKLDLSKFPELGKIKIRNCSNIDVLDFTSTPNVTNVAIGNDAGVKSKLKSINISNNEKLKYFTCDNASKLKTIKFGKMSSLRNMYISNCKKLAKVDISTATKLRHLMVAKCSLKKLDTSKNKNLESLDCSQNRITKLDISKNKKLKSLNCKKNIIKKVSIGKTKLKAKKVKHDKKTIIVVK